MFTNPFIPELCPVCQAEMPPKTRSAPVSRSPVSREHLTRGHLTQEHALYDRIKALEAQNADLLAALKALQAGFADGSIRFTRTRQSDTDPYHPANILMCAAIAKAEGVTP